MTRLTIRIDFEDRGSFGPGKARLLETVDELGSLRRAAAAMEMSYRQAWLLVQAAEESFGSPLVETATGGAGGGGSRLTALGRDVLARYRAIETMARRSAETEISELGRLTSSGGRAGRRRLRPRKKP